MRIIFPLLVLIFLLNINCNNTVSPPPPDPGTPVDSGYRVIVGPNIADTNGEPILPSHNSDWTLEYKFIVPPEPAANWNYQKQTVYTYGQVDFDLYGSEGPFSISSYQYNQIVPQVMIGNCQDGNDSNYNPTGDYYQDWVVQAQYFWMNSNGTPYALCGNIVYVNPGDELTTTISYSASSLAITASISGPSGTSMLVINRPFLNDNSFTDWGDFFSQAEQQSGTVGPYGDAALNVETHYMDALTVCTILPFNVNHVTIPGISWVNGNYYIVKSPTFNCLDSAILHY